MDALIQFLILKAPDLKIKLIEQCYLVGLSTLLALVVAFPLGLIIHQYPKVKNTTLSIISALWTIPSLALLAFFIPFLGIGIKPAIITLAIYAILPILRNTVTGLEGVPAESIEAARGLGFTKRQSLWMVEIPLAMPVIVAGIRTATSISVGVATLAAFVGAGGLGDFINQGLALNSTKLLLLGAIPAAIMALLLDFIIGQIEKDLQFKARRKGSSHKLRLIALITLIVLLLSYIGSFAFSSWMDQDDTIIVGSKNFGEQIILGDMMAQMLNAKTHLHVIKKLNLGSTAICQAALLNGEIDIYPEYTGTAYLTVLHKQYKKSTPEALYQEVKHDYLKRFDLVWLPPFGFNNSEAIVVREAFANRYHLTTISDLIAIENKLTIGAPSGFIERPDGLIGLKKVYHLTFKSVKQMDPGIMYKAIANHDVNVIAGFSTDGRIPAYHLTILKDNKQFYPPYYAAPIIRGDFLKQHPQVLTALKPLFGLINDKTMQHLNYEVDVENKSPNVVAHDFLVSKGLLPTK